VKAEGGTNETVVSQFVARLTSKAEKKECSHELSVAEGDGYPPKDFVNPSVEIVPISKYDEIQQHQNHSEFLTLLDHKY